MKRIRLSPDEIEFHDFLIQNKYHNSANALAFLLLRDDFSSQSQHFNSKQSAEKYFRKLQDNFYLYHMCFCENSDKDERVTSKDYSIHLMCLKVLVVSLFVGYQQVLKHKELLESANVPEPKIQDGFNSGHNYPHILLFDEETEINPKSYYLNFSPYLRSTTEIIEFLKRDDIVDAIHSSVFGGEVIRTKITSDANLIKHIELYNKYFDLKFLDTTQSITSLEDLENLLSYEKSKQIKDDLEAIYFELFNKNKNYKAISKLLLEMKNTLIAVNGK